MTENNWQPKFKIGDRVRATLIEYEGIIDFVICQITMNKYGIHYDVVSRTVGIVIFKEEQLTLYEEQPLKPKRIPIPNNIVFQDSWSTRLRLRFGHNKLLCADDDGFQIFSRACNDKLIVPCELEEVEVENGLPKNAQVGEFYVCGYYLKRLTAIKSYFLYVKGTEAKSRLAWRYINENYDEYDICATHLTDKKWYKVVKKE